MAGSNRGRGGRAASAAIRATEEELEIPWDIPSLRRQIIELAHRRRAAPLEEAFASKASGVYVFFMCDGPSGTGSPSKLYGRLRTGSRPWYIGSAQCLCERGEWHFETFDDVKGLSAARFRAICIEFPQSP